jgi:predicted GNAT family N-acyltransferase
MIEVKFYENKDHYDDVMYVREDVFIREQGFSTDKDEIDNHCTHILFLDDNKPFATGRIFNEDGDIIIGRVCVLEAYRGKGYGIKIIQELEKKAKERGATSTVLGAQCQAKEFYLKLGYEEFGDIYFDEYCPHIHMRHTF